MHKLLESRQEPVCSRSCTQEYYGRQGCDACDGCSAYRRHACDADKQKAEPITANRRLSTERFDEHAQDVTESMVLASNSGEGLAKLIDP